MKRFIYCYSERTPRNGHTHKTVRIYRILRDKVVFLIERTDTFVDEFQPVWEALESIKALPKKAFARNANTNAAFHNSWSWRGAGIADVKRVC